MSESSGSWRHGAMVPRKAGCNSSRLRQRRRRQLPWKWVAAVLWQPHRVRLWGWGKLVVCRRHREIQWSQPAPEWPVDSRLLLQQIWGFPPGLTQAEVDRLREYLEDPPEPWQDPHP